MVFLPQEKETLEMTLSGVRVYGQIDYAGQSQDYAGVGPHLNQLYQFPCWKYFPAGVLVTVIQWSMWTVGLIMHKMSF